MWIEWDKVNGYAFSYSHEMMVIAAQIMALYLITHQHFLKSSIRNIISEIPGKQPHKISTSHCPWDLRVQVIPVVCGEWAVQPVWVSFPTEAAFCLPTPISKYFGPSGPMISVIVYLGIKAGHSFLAKAITKPRLGFFLSCEWPQAAPSKTHLCPLILLSSLMPFHASPSYLPPWIPFHPQWS